MKKILCIVFIILAILIGLITFSYKYNQLSSLMEGVNNNQKNFTNYEFTNSRQSGETDIYVMVKDGKTVEVMDNLKTYINYDNNDYFINENDKTYYVTQTGQTDTNFLNPLQKFEDMSKIKLYFTLKLEEIELNETKCYKLTNKETQEVFIFNKTNYLPVQINDVTIVDFKRDTITDTAMALPDLTEYENLSNPTE